MAEHMNQLYRFFRKKMFCDIILISDDGLEIAAHKIVLASVSHVFHTMFTGEFKERSENKVSIQNMDFKILKAIVKFAYMLNVNIKDTNVEKLWMAADMYDINYMKELCSEYIKNNINPTKCVSYMNTSELLSDKEMYNFCWSYFLNNFSTIANTDLALEKLYEFPLDGVLEFIKHDDLIVDTEEKIFDFIIGWIKYNSNERNHMLLDLIKCLRLYLLSQEGIQRICDEPIVRNNKDTMAYMLNEITKINFDKLGRNKSTGTNIVFGINRALNPASKECPVWYMDFRCHDKLKWKLSKHLSFGVPRCDSRLVACENGIILAIGGLNESNKYANVVDELDLKSTSKKWVPTTRLKQPRENFGVCTHKRYVYVIGGYLPGLWYRFFLNSVEYYDTKSKVWTEIIEQMHNPRSMCSATIYNNQLFVFGGHNGEKGHLADVEYYDFEKKYWEQLDPMPIANRLMGITTIDNVAYIIGGVDAYRQIFKFDLQDFRWEEMPNMSSGTHNAISSVLVKKNDLFVCVNERGVLHCEKFDTKERKWQLVDSVITKLERSSIINLNERALKSFGIHLNR